jgi:hypothetical protein
MGHRALGGVVVVTSRRSRFSPQLFTLIDNQLTQCIKKAGRHLTIAPARVNTIKIIEAVLVSNVNVETRSSCLGPAFGARKLPYGQLVVPLLPKQINLRAPVYVLYIR